MLIDISELISNDSLSRSYEVPVEMEELVYEGCSYPVTEKEPAALHLTGKGKSKVTMRASVRMAIRMPCSRCLKDVRIPFDFTDDRELDFEKIRRADPDDIDEFSYIEGHSLDVDRFVQNELIVRLPAKVLCREDCAGLCPICGRDLNEGECGCDRTPPDTRMSAIRDIFKDFKEV